MAESYDQETEAIGALLKSLGPLGPKSRMAVLAYVAGRLEIALPEVGKTRVDTPPDSTLPKERPEIEDSVKNECHISELVHEKKPKSAIEMAALVAYYLSHKAPKGDRKQTISTDDLTTYFKIAEFKLPKAPQYTLNNTRIAGYLESAGSGEYKLNPVGYNLIVHSMPRTTKQITHRRSPKTSSPRAKTRKSKSKARKA